MQTSDIVGECRNFSVSEARSYITHHAPIYFIGDSQACGFLAAGCVAVCVIGCAASTIAYGICVAICSAGCLAIEAGCLARAKGRLNACNMTCDIARMTCDPGWVPPAAE